MIDPRVIGIAESFQSFRVGMRLESFALKISLLAMDSSILIENLTNPEQAHGHRNQPDSRLPGSECRR